MIPIWVGTPNPSSGDSTPGKNSCAFGNIHYRVHGRQQVCIELIEDKFPKSTIKLMLRTT